jgi:hypothetical protein
MIARFGLQTLAIVAVGFTVGALAGCQHEAAGVALEAAPAGYGLHFSDEGETAKLAYGRANSDEVGLMLECEKGSRQVALTDVMHGGPPQFVLTSGGRRSNLKAQVQDIEGGKILAATARTDSPALAGFRDSGQLQVASGKIHYAVTATTDEKASVRRFFAVCERV